MLQLHYRDSLDRELVAQLLENARYSATFLAKRLKVARSTVHERIARLERDGVIRGYTVIVSRDPSEEVVKCLLFLAIDKRCAGRIVDRLEHFHEIKYCAAIDGDYDLFCELEAPRLEDIDIVIDEIARLPDVERMRSTVVYCEKFKRAAPVETACRPQTGPVPVLVKG